MDSIGDLIKNVPNASPDVELIKKFVFEKYNKKITVISQNNNYIIVCDSAALAGSLRMQTQNIQGLLSSNKSISIRIGQV